MSADLPPSHFCNILARYYLHGEVPPSDLTPIQIVSQADEERARLEKDIEVGTALTVNSRLYFMLFLRSFFGGLSCLVRVSCLQLLTISPQELLDKSDAEDMDANAAALEDMLAVCFSFNEKL